MSRRYTSFESRFLRFATPIEKGLVLLILVLFLLLVTIQLLLSYPPIRSYLVKLEQLEGVKVEQRDPASFIDSPEDLWYDKHK